MVEKAEAARRRNEGEISHDGKRPENAGPEALGGANVDSPGDNPSEARKKPGHGQEERHTGARLGQPGQHRDDRISRRKSTPQRKKKHMGAKPEGTRIPKHARRPKSERRAKRKETAHREKASRTEKETTEQAQTRPRAKRQRTTMHDSPCISGTALKAPLLGR